MNGLGLSADDLAKRRRYIQGGDAALILDGRWRELWALKTGRMAEADASLPAHMRFLAAENIDLLRAAGNYQEPFNLAWADAREPWRKIQYYSASPLCRYNWEYLTGRAAHAEEHHVHPQLPYLAANFDGVGLTRDGRGVYIDAKRLSRASEKEIIAYTPQGTHCALVCGVDVWALSIIAGGKWEMIEQEVDPFFAVEYLDKCRQFWGYVERDEEPPEMTAKLVPKPAPTLRTIVIDGGSVDPETGVWSGPSDERFQPWPNWGSDFAKHLAAVIRTQGAATVNAISREEIKKLVPDDVGEVRRGNTIVKRDKAGAIRFTLPKGDQE